MNLNAVDLLRDLVRLPSVNPMGRSWPSEENLYEHRVTDYLEAFFRQLNVRWHRQIIAPKRANIIAYYQADRAERTYLFEVHQDTVPVEAMTIDPFGGDIRAGKLYGRGSCDVKGGMSAMLSVLARLAQEKPVSAANLIVACTVDEEHTFLGVQELVKQGIRADYAIVAEPTGLQIVDAHKGVVRWKLHTSGRACHSSQPDRGINAIYRMGQVLKAIEEYSEVLAAGRYDDRLGEPSISVGRIEGGVSVNTVPDACVIEIDRRLLPGERPEDARADLQLFLRQHPAISFPVTCEPIWLACPALNSAGSTEIVERLGQAIDSICSTHQTIAVPFGTDASTISEANIPAVVFGPGDIAQAHTCDEWIDLNQVHQAVEILYNLVTTG